MRLAPVLLCLFLSIVVEAQPLTLIGTVVDADGGRPLVGATAVVGGRGVVSDAAGQFRLALQHVPATVVVRYLGYQPVSVVVRASDAGGDGFAHRTIRLQPTEIELGGVTVTDENAAIAIMRQVLARKLALKEELPSYSAEEYTRFTLRGNGRYIRFTEELSDLYWRAEGGSREVVLARRRRPEGRAFRYAAPQPVPDFYSDDDVVLDGFRFPSPTHPDALSIYHFRIGDVTEVNGLRLIDIAVRPQRSGATALVGRIQVVDSLFVFADAELRPAGGVHKPPPVESYSATYRTVFSPVADSIWLPERFYMNGRVNVGAPGARLPQVIFNQATSLSVRQMNTVSPDSLWQHDRRRVEASGVYGGREVFLRYRDKLPLSDEEAEAELSLGPIPLRALLPVEGLLRNYIPIPVEEPPSAEEQAQRKATPMSTLMRAPRLWYNRVDRTYVGIQPTFELGNALTVSPEIGLSPDTSFFTTGIRATFRPIGRFAIDLGVRRGTATRYASPGYNRLMNTVPTYLGWPDYFDYLEEDRVDLTVWHRVAPRIHVGVGGISADQRSVQSTSSFEGAITGNGQRDNRPIDDGTLRAGTFNLEIGNRPARLGVPSPGFGEVVFERGHLDPSDSSSAMAFTRLSGQVDLSIPTFFRRRPNPHVLSLRAVGGLSWGGIPIQRLGIVDGRNGPFSGFGSLRTVNLPYEGSRWAGLVWNYDVGRTLFESLGLAIPTGLALHGGHAWTSVDTGRDFGFNVRTNSAGHHELGLSLVRPLNFPIHADLTRRLGAPAWFFTFGISY